MLNPEIEQKFRYIIEQNIAAGFARGQDLFAESLNEDLQKNIVLEKHSLDGILGYLLNEAVQPSRQGN